METTRGGDETKAKEFRVLPVPCIIINMIPDTAMSLNDNDDH